MKRTSLFLILLLSVIVVANAVPFQLFAQNQKKQQILDTRVKVFLESHQHDWYDMNIPMNDGQLLYDIIVKNNYTKGLEIGTSTGHSTIWLAWAMSKTGGKVITIEIDKRRHEKALANLKEAGLLEYVDARLADAHKLVKELKGPFDFVFSDADKGWYTQYFIDTDPKLEVGGCFTAHNVRRSGHWSRGGTGDYLRHVESLSNYETTVDEKGGGVAISYKKK